MWKWRVSSILLCCYFSAYSFHDYLSLFGGWREKISLQPHFDYCSAVWDDLSHQLRDSLEKLRNPAVRVITKSRYVSSLAWLGQLID